MPMVAAEIVALIYKLLPGFVAAWVFYSLTAHPRKGPFERTVQALIFTVITQAFVIPIGWGLVWLGRNWRVLGPWNDDSALVVSVVTAFVLGLIFAALANTSCLHSRLPKWVSRRTSFPSEWYSVFRNTERYVYLHLNGGRRIYGWPSEWPDSPRSGHLVLERPEWITDENVRVPLLLIERMLIRATDVVMVEFEKPESEWTFDRQAQKACEEKLIQLNKDAKEEKSDGQKKAE